MRPEFTRISRSLFVCGCLAMVPGAVHAQGARRLEISAVGGAAHTSRVGRLSAEQWLEPFAGARLDARLWQLAGGRVGVSAFADYFSFGRNVMAPRPCLDVCLLSSYVLPEIPLVEYRSTGGDLRVAAGATWRRPLTRWLSADLGGFAGMRRASSAMRFEAIRTTTSTAYRPMVGGEVGLTTQRGALLSGLSVQLASSVLEGGVRRSQNRVAMRLGWALP